MTPEQFRKWKIVPTVTLLGYCYLVFTVTNWFMLLESPTAIQQAFVTLVWGGALLWIKFFKGGKSED